MHISDEEGCCGILILNGVGYSDTDDGAEALVKELNRVVLRNGPYGQLVTKNLTDNQLSYSAMKEVFLPEIFKRGWRLVTRFRNPNSGNIVNVFHYTAAKRVAKLHNKYRPANVGNQRST